MRGRRGDCRAEEAGEERVNELLNVEERQYRKRQGGNALEISRLASKERIVLQHHGQITCSTGASEPNRGMRASLKGQRSKQNKYDKERMALAGRRMRHHNPGFSTSRD